MRVLIASDQFWPMVSGCATAGRNLAQGLSAHHEVLVIAPSQNGHRHNETDGNYQIVRIRSVTVPARQNLRIALDIQNEVPRIIQEFKPDIVHVHTQLTLGLATLWAAKKAGLPVVATNHVMPQNIVDNLPILTPFARGVKYIMQEYGPQLYKGADCIIMPTQSAIDMFKPGAFGNVPVQAVSNGIDLSQVGPGPVPKETLRKFGLPDARPIVTYLGRLDAEKHVDTLVRALAVVRKSVPVHGLIVGTGNAVGRLKDLAKELGLEAEITFTGLVSDSDRTKLHRVGKVFVMPSPAELQSIATLEAMASGQPIVAANAGALAELCHHGANGFLFKLDDADDLAKYIVKIVSQPELRRDMSRESLRLAGEHELSHVMREFEKIYERTVEQHAEQMLGAAQT